MAHGLHFFFTNLVNCRLNNCIWVFWIMRVHYAYTVYIWKAIWILKLYVLIFLSFCTRAKKCNYNARAIKVEQCMCWGPDWDCFCVLFNYVFSQILKFLLFINSLKRCADSSSNKSFNLRFITDVHFYYFQ